MMPNDNIYFLDSSLFTLGHFVISLNPARFKNPEPYPGKPRITDILANIGSQYTKVFCAKITELSKVNFCITDDNAPLRQNVHGSIISPPTTLQLHSVMEERPTSKIFVTAVLALCLVGLHVSDVSLREQQAEKTLDHNSRNRQNRKLLQYNTSMYSNQWASSKPRHELQHALTEVRNKK